MFGRLLVNFQAMFEERKQKYTNKYSYCCYRQMTYSRCNSNQTFIEQQIQTI